MIRTLLIVTVVIGSAATAVAAISGSQVTAPAKNVTVIEMNNVWASQADLSVEACAKEDCSDTPQG
jgi:chemotaxis protein CheY-P-specific phosphatase CheC